ncbi:hypothetical protein CZ787_14790 [Halomonas citrativorans]|uniref:Uncharacterized protein n=1 Tax=Halomonas citrativorans TaxID=2742612 RepID=A0A1R4I3D3_9GAMM|nr:hypothetical protein CZ787_14790 [Halomonas citrativorans]
MLAQSQEVFSESCLKDAIKSHFNNCAGIIILNRAGVCEALSRNAS